MKLFKKDLQSNKLPSHSSTGMISLRSLNIDSSKDSPWD